MRGVLITVEGVEGSGKTTQCERLGQWLHARGFEVVRDEEKRHLRDFVNVYHATMRRSE